MNFPPTNRRNSGRLERAFQNQQGRATSFCLLDPTHLVPSSTLKTGVIQQSKALRNFSLEHCSLSRAKFGYFEDSFLKSILLLFLWSCQPCGAWQLCIHFWAKGNKVEEKHQFHLSLAPACPESDRTFVLDLGIACTISRSGLDFDSHWSFFSADTIFYIPHLGL